MSNLPNSNKDRIKVYPNEYITNATINRPNLRLLQNDLYLEQLWTDAISGLIHLAGTISHDDLRDITPDQHHPQSHTIASHDTKASGAELTQLTNGSNADALHTHSAAANHGHSHMDGTDQIPTVTSTAYGIMSPDLFNQLDDAVLKNTNQTINSDKIINGDVTVHGTFRATSAVFVETENLGLSANYINLNTNVTGVPTQDAGISVIRGTSSNSVLNWNEGKDRWEGGLSGSQETLVLSSDLDSLNTEITYLSSEISGNKNDITNLQIGQIDFFIPGNYNSSVLSGILTNIGHNYSVWRQSPAHITHLYATHYGVDSVSQPYIALSIDGITQPNIQLSGTGDWVSQSLNVPISGNQTLNIDLTSLSGGAGDATDLTVSLTYTIN